MSNTEANSENSASTRPETSFASLSMPRFNTTNEYTDYVSLEVDGAVQFQHASLSILLFHRTRFLRLLCIIAILPLLLVLVGARAWWTTEIPSGTVGVWDYCADDDESSCQTLCPDGSQPNFECARLNALRGCLITAIILLAIDLALIARVFVTRLFLPIEISKNVKSFSTFLSLACLCLSTAMFAMAVTVTAESTLEQSFSKMGWAYGFVLNGIVILLSFINFYAALSKSPVMRF